MRQKDQGDHMSYDEMDSVELRAELDEWTQRTIQWADDIAESVEYQDFWRAIFMLHGYKQARMKMKQIRHAMRIGVA